MSETIVHLDGDELNLTVSREGDVWEITRDGEVHRIELLESREGEAVLRIGERRVVVPFLSRGGDIDFLYGGEYHRASVMSATDRPRRRHQEHSMSAPMPGVVLKLFVETNQAVRKGEALLILEAMKMEHQITAPYDGRVEKIHCSEGEMVQPGVDLISIEPEESEE